MKQILQTLKTGDVEVVEMPVPPPRNRSLIIRNRASLVSAGTEQSNTFIRTAPSGRPLAVMDEIISLSIFHGSRQQNCTRLY